jgi:hypothetical protein
MLLVITLPISALMVAVLQTRYNNDVNILSVERQERQVVYNETKTYLQKLSQATKNLATNARDGQYNIDKYDDVWFGEFYQLLDDGETPDAISEFLFGQFEESEFEVMLQLIDVLVDGNIDIDTQQPNAKGLTRAGVYISNENIGKMFLAIALNPIPAVLIGIGIHKVCALIAAAGAKLGAMLGSWGGPVVAIVFALVGLAVFGELATTFVEAILQGKGIRIGLKYTWFGMPYGFGASVE